MHFTNVLILTTKTTLQYTFLYYIILYYIYKYYYCIHQGKPCFILRFGTFRYSQYYYLVLNSHFIKHSYLSTVYDMFDVLVIQEEVGLRQDVTKYSHMTKCGHVTGWGWG